MKKIKRIGGNIGVVVGILLIVALALGFVTSFNRSTKNIGASAFSIGGLDDNGEYVAQDYTLFTKELIECQGLSIEPDFTSNVSYRVYLYNSDKKLLEASEELTGNYKLTNTFAQYCRIMIIPENAMEKDFSISYFDIRGIVKELDITVNREQKFQLKNYFDTSKENDNKIVVNTDGVITYTEKAGYGYSEAIEIGEVESFVVKFTGNMQSSGAEIIFATAGADGEYTYVNAVDVTGEESSSTVSVPEGATHMFVNYKLTDGIVINQAQ